MKTFRREVCSLYLLAVFVFIPIMFRYNYQDIASFKAMFYIMAAGILLICGVIAAAGEFAWNRQWGVPVRSVGEIAKTFSLMDWGILSFGLVVFISSLSTRYSIVSTLLADKSVFVGGGVLVLLCTSYFVISRFADQNRNNWIKGFYVVTFLVVLLGVLNHMEIDPIGMHQNNARSTIHFMASTIGNVDFFYGYLAIVTIFFAAVRLNLSWDKAGIAVDVLLFICFICVLTARAGGVFPGLFFGIGILVFNALGNIKRLKNLFWLGILTAISGIAAEIIHMINANLYYRIETEISGVIIKYHAYLPFGLLCLCVWLLLNRAEKMDSAAEIEAQTAKWKIPWAILVGILFMSISFIVLFFAPLKSMTGRAEVWDAYFEVFRLGNIKEKLAGIGPGSMDAAVDLYGIARIKGHQYETGHNEFVEYILTLGILGLAAYICAFFGAVSSYINMSMKEEKHWEAGCVVAGIMAFLGQGLTNGPNPVPTIFAFTFLALLRRYQIEEEEDFSI